MAVLHSMEETWCHLEGTHCGLDVATLWLPKVPVRRLVLDCDNVMCGEIFKRFKLSQMECV